MQAIAKELWEKILLIMRVQTGAMSVAAAARQLRISRKTFYQQAQRAMAGMAAALTPRPAGRPGPVKQPEVECLLGQNAGLRMENLELRRILRIRELLHKARTEDGQGTKKKAVPGRGGARGRGDRTR